MSRRRRIDFSNAASVDIADTSLMNASMNRCPRSLTVILALFLLLTTQIFASERYWSPSTSTSNGSIIVIDAGSSGSRVHVYRLQCRGPDELLRIDEAVESSKIEPGISSFVNTPEKAAHSLRPLIRYVENVIPAREHSSTDLVLLATAGLHPALPIHDAETILKATRALIRAESPFSSETSGYDQQKRGSRFWTAVNYATNRIGHDGIRSTVGVLDMGGEVQRKL